MERLATKYKTDPIRDILVISTRKDRFGDIWFYVEWDYEQIDFSRKKDYFRFSKMDSVLDFINSNFK